MSAPISYGIELMPEALPSGKKWLAITTPPLIGEIEGRFGCLFARVHIAPEMEEPVLQAWERGLPKADAVLGIGGGVVMDAAKYVAWSRCLPLWLAPSAASVDACVTESIAVRREGRVRYVGVVHPQAVLIDYGLIQSAPANLNRAGAGDILSIHTALWDWQLAARETGEGHDPHIAEQTAHLLVRLGEAAKEIRAVTESGIRTLVELFAAEVDLCSQAGSSRPEEGSEHFWAYNVEYRTRRHHVHGELVTLGVLLMAALQGNDMPSARALADRIGVRWHPGDMGLNTDEIVDALITSREYVGSEALPFSALNMRTISADSALEVVEQVCRGS